jgi:hypothetical protein
MNVYPESLPKKCYSWSNFNSHGYIWVAGVVYSTKRNKRALNPSSWHHECVLVTYAVGSSPSITLPTESSEKSPLLCHLVVKYLTNWSIIPPEIVVFTIVLVSSECMIRYSTCFFQLNDFVGAVKSVLQPSNHLPQSGAGCYIVWPGNGWYIMLHESSGYLQCLLKIS